MYTTHPHAPTPATYTDHERLLVSGLLAERSATDDDTEAWAWVTTEPERARLDVSRQYNVVASLASLAIVAVMALGFLALVRLHEASTDRWYVDAMAREGVEVAPIASGVGAVGYALGAALAVATALVVARMVRSAFRARERAALLASYEECR